MGWTLGMIKSVQAVTLWDLDVPGLSKVSLAWFTVLSCQILSVLSLRVCPLVALCLQWLDLAVLV